MSRLRIKYLHWRGDFSRICDQPYRIRNSNRIPDFGRQRREIAVVYWIIYMQAVRRLVRKYDQARRAPFKIGGQVVIIDRDVRFQRWD